MIVSWGAGNATDASVCPVFALVSFDGNAWGELSLAGLDCNGLPLGEAASFEGAGGTPLVESEAKASLFGLELVSPALEVVPSLGEDGP